MREQFPLNDHCRHLKITEVGLQLYVKVLNLCFI